jgi:hypothetical protein
MVETITDYANLSNDFGGTAKKAFNFLGKLIKEYSSGTGINIIEFSSGTAVSLTFNEFEDTLVSRSESIPAPPPKS